MSRHIHLHIGDRGNLLVGDAGTSEGAKKAWQKRKRGGGGKRPPDPPTAGEKRAAMTPAARRRDQPGAKVRTSMQGVTTSTSPQLHKGKGMRGTPTQFKIKAKPWTPVPTTGAQAEEKKHYLEQEYAKRTVKEHHRDLNDLRIKAKQGTINREEALKLAYLTKRYRGS